MQDNIYQDAKILIIDDQEANVRLLQSIFKKWGYRNVVATNDPRQVPHLFGMLQPDLILLDLVMLGTGGFQVLQHISELVPRGTYFPVLVLTAEATPEAKLRALSLGAKDFLAKPFDQAEVLLRIKNLLETRFLHLQIQRQNQILEQKVQERTQELEQAQLEVLERLAVAAEYRDDDTGQHTRRVGYVSALLASASGLPREEVELIERVAPLHDVGKIGIPDDILLKPARLTSQEFEMMKTHTIIGARILSGGRSDMVRMAQTIALTHHERWDGAGYPQRLKGEAIPKVGRIVALADTFDALMHKRPYKEAWDYEKAVAELKSQSGKQFDSQLVEAFLHMDESVLTPPEETLPNLPTPGLETLEDVLHQPPWRSVTEPLAGRVRTGRLGSA